MRKVLIKLIVLLTTLSGIGLGSIKAQYSIFPYQPPISFTHLDLWQMNIMGPSDTNYVEFYVTLRVFDGQNTLLVKSQSSNFQLLTSSLYVAPNNLGPLSPLIISYTVDGFYANLVNTGGTFPAGTYHIDYALYGRPLDGEFSELAENSLEVNVESLFPPMLISVEDNDTICEQYPIFTWTPAYQASNPADLTYYFKMSEVYAFQSTYQAIASNPYYYSQMDIPITMLNYPTSAATLVQGQQYAWQVDAIINNQVAASSEIWSFVYGCPSDTIVDSIPTLPYVKLRLERDGGEYKMSNKFLYINYVERYFPGENAHLQYRIYNRITNEYMPLNNVVLNLVEGENYYIISTCGDGLDLPDGAYQFIVTDNKGTKWYVDFIRENIECN